MKVSGKTASICAAVGVMFVLTGIGSITEKKIGEGIFTILIGILLLVPMALYLLRDIQAEKNKKLEEQRQAEKKLLEEEQRRIEAAKPKYYEGYKNEIIPLEGFLTKEVQMNIEASFMHEGDELQYDYDTGEVFCNYRKIGKFSAPARKKLKEHGNVSVRYDGEQIVDVSKRIENWETEPIVRVLYLE